MRELQLLCLNSFISISHSVDASIPKSQVPPARTLNMTAWFRQFWKQCRDRGERRGRCASYVPERWNPRVQWWVTFEWPSITENLAEEHTTGGNQWRSATVSVQSRIDIFSTIFETWAELSLVSDITEIPENELAGKNSANFHNNIHGWRARA